MSIQALPDEVTLSILSNLGVQSLGRFCLVSHEANRLASDDKLWKPFFPEEMIPKSGVKAYLDAHGVGSEDQLIIRVQAFAEKIRWGQKGRLDFHLSDYNFVIRFISGDLPLENAPNITAVMGGEMEYDLTEDILCLWAKRKEATPALCMKTSGYPGKTFLMILGTGIEPQVTEIGDIIKSRLDDLREEREEHKEEAELENRSTLDWLLDINDDPRFSFALTVTSIAMSALLVGLYFWRRR